MATIEDLQKQINELGAQLKKHQNIIARTGQQIVELRLGEQRKNIRELDSRNKSLQRDAGIKQEEEYVTSEDLVELVQELQGQLDLLDERNVRRIVNSRASASAHITALPNTGGDYPEKFPQTAGDFESLPDSGIEELCQFYELLPPDESEIQDMLKKANITAEQAGIPKPEETKKTIPEQFNLLAQYLGLPARRSA